MIVTPEYDLAPEKKFLTQVEQCYAALLWARDHAEEYQANPEKMWLQGIVPEVIYPQLFP